MPHEARGSWWLEGGPDDEECPHCLAVYAYEVELRCTACDGPGCPRCMVVERERLTVACPACPPGGAGDDEEAS